MLDLNIRFACKNYISYILDIKISRNNCVYGILNIFKDYKKRYFLFLFSYTDKSGIAEFYIFNKNIIELIKNLVIFIQSRIAERHKKT